MSNDFEAFMNAQKANDFDALDQKIKDQVPKKGFEADPRFWDTKHLRGEDGNGEATIRFLPVQNPSDSPFVRVWHHQYRRTQPDGSFRWYIENSLKTIGQEDPVYKYNGQFAAQTEENKKLRISRLTKYIANILVLDDPAAPENNGKVFLYSFGAQIFELIQGQMTPKFKSDKRVDPFNVFTGADFNIRIWTKVVGKDKMPQYDKSKFLEPSELGGNAAKAIKAVFPLLVDVNEFIAPDQFKTYEVLENRLNFVLGISNADGSTYDSTKANGNGQWKEDVPDEVKEVKKALEKAPIEDDIPEEFKSAPVKVPESSADEDDFFAQFKKK